MLFKYWEILKGLLPFLIKLDGATRLVFFIIAIGTIGSNYFIDYVDAKHVQVTERIKEKELHLSNKMDQNQKVLISLMNSMRDNINKTQGDVRDTQKNVIQIYRDLGKISRSN